MNNAKVSRNFAKAMSVTGAIVGALSTVNADIPMIAKVGISCGVALGIWVGSMAIANKNKVGQIVEGDLTEIIEEDQKEYITADNFKASKQYIAIGE